MTNSNAEREAPEFRSTLFRSLADGPKRRVLGLVCDRAPSAVAVGDVAAHLAADDERPADVSDEQRRRARIQLEHSLLPSLADADLIERDDDEIRATDRLSLEAELVDLAREAAAADDSLEAVFDALGDRRRRHVLAVLDEQPTAISIRTLARDVAACEDGTTERAVSNDRVDDVQVSLVHSHLPRLRDASLVDYDESKTNPAVTRSDRRTEWLGDLLEAGADGWPVAPTDSTTDALSGHSY